jgi:hypothetical protein
VSGGKMDFLPPITLKVDGISKSASEFITNNHGTVEIIESDTPVKVKKFTA